MVEAISIKLALIITNLIPYHAARFSAVRKLMGDGAHLIELSRHDAEFSTLEAPIKDANVHTLFARDPWSAVDVRKLGRALDDALSKMSPDVVVVNGWGFPSAISAITWARRNEKAVVILSESQVNDAPRKSIKEAVKSRVVRLCDAALVGGRTHKNYIVSLGMPSDRVFLGYDVVDNAHFIAGADAARMRSTGSVRGELPARYILACSRFVQKKNIVSLVRGYDEACNAVDDMPDLVLVGDGPERRVIEDAIARSRVSAKIHLPGFASYEELPRLYGLAEGFVHVSSSEQWGLVINEAAAAGLPLVVSSACGAACELVAEGENGYLVDPNHESEIAAALRRLMTLPTEVRSRMGVASRELVSKWTPERFANELLLACTKALSGPKLGYGALDRALLAALRYRRI